MQTVLTIEIEDAVLSKAETIAAAHNSTVNGMIREYISALSQGFTPSKEQTPVLSSLSGILSIDKEPDELENEYKEYRATKHLADS